MQFRYGKIYSWTACRNYEKFIKEIMNIYVKRFEQYVKSIEYAIGNLIKNFELTDGVCDIKHPTRQEYQCTHHNIEARNETLVGT